MVILNNRYNFVFRASNMEESESITVMYDYDSGIVSNIRPLNPQDQYAIDWATVEYIRDEIEDSFTIEFQTLAIGAHFYDPMSGEYFRKESEISAKCLSGGDYFENGIGEFDKSDLVIPR